MATLAELEAAGQKAVRIREALRGLAGARSYYRALLRHLGSKPDIEVTFEMETGERKWGTTTHSKQTHRMAIPPGIFFNRAIDNIRSWERRVVQEGGLVPPAFEVHSAPLGGWRVLEVDHAERHSALRREVSVHKDRDKAEVARDEAERRAA